MTARYRILLECYNDENVTEEKRHQTILLDDVLTPPSNCLNVGMGFARQVELIQAAQDKILMEEMALLKSGLEQCPDCSGKLYKHGTQYSTFSDVLTDHKVSIQRLKCNACGYESPSTIRTLFDTTQSGELKKIQASLGANYTYRASEEILKLFSLKERRINNHDRIKKVTEGAGNVIATITEMEKEITVTDVAKELIVNVDGGHINTREPGKRSMEAMTSVIYRPEAIESNKKDTRRYLKSKSCSASVNDDNQEQIISATIVAGLKQGLSSTTEVTALCDGAANCWKVVDALRPLCKQVTCILDWFHLAMKLENISLPKQLKTKLLRIKWHLWRGNIDNALTRLDQLMTLASDEKHIGRIKKFKIYISNNKDRIVNYSQRKKAGLIFTSNLAESTVESLINRRCKGQQHMRWSREGLNPVLQLRAAMNSKEDWQSKWKTAILNVA